MTHPGRLRAVAVLATGALLLSGCSAGDGQNGTGGGEPSAAASSTGPETVKIAAGVDTQTRVLAHLYQQRLSADGVPATVVDVGSTREEIFDALQDGRATMVPDFTGDLYVYARQHEVPASQATGASPTPAPSASADTDAPRGLLDSLGQLLGITGETGPSGDDVYRALPDVMPSGLEVLDSSGAQRTDQVVVTAATDAQYDLKSLDGSGKQCGKLAVGMPTDYADSAQGEPGLKAYYDCDPKAAPEYKTTDELVNALLTDQVQAAVLRSSEPVIQDDGLVALEDPNRLFRPEHAVVVGSEKLSDQAVSSVNAVTAELTTEDLTTITRLTGGEDPAMSPEKAATYLREQPR
ncbi:glycine betaine ABC transporter substrate-binding protein [Kocuria rhizophila]|uniref:glycine betaine ABC transporter substrate-binding protein n=1 Tax=Kocuria rhizophila TaxID=72000 RepID=UPI0007501FCE|nr:glycine betaine ABC transporter substrate-binding protein [Kocuria rhizophila]KUP28127.1 ABC transporter substrate-binding protein [Kocuria rhizophila]